MRSPNARAMIAAAKRDLPSPDLESALLGSLGVAGATALTPPLALKLWATLKHAAVSKVSIGFVALGTAASGGYVAGRMQERTLHRDEQVVRAETSAVVKHPLAARVVTPPPSSSVAVAIAVPIETLPESPPVVAPVAIASAPPSVLVDEPAPQSPPPPSEHASLADEVDAIRRARTDLLAGGAKAALVELDAYAAAHPNGTLEEESLALRVRANRLAGDGPAADRALRDLETRFPSSVQLRALRK